MLTAMNEYSKIEASIAARMFRQAVVSEFTGERGFAFGPVRMEIIGHDIQRTARGCIEWPYGRQQAGYGTLVDNKLGTSIVSRQVLLLTQGPPPESEGRYLACHSCDNPPCIAPEHLRWGTEQDNMEDRTLRGRMPNYAGSRNPNAILTEDDIHLIDARLSAGESQASVALAFGIAQTNVAAIRSRKSWRHVEPRVELPQARIRRRRTSEDC